MRTPTQLSKNKNIELNESGLDFYMRVLYRNTVHQKEVKQIPLMAIECLCTRYGIQARTREMRVDLLKNIAMKECRLFGKNSPLTNLRMIED